ncbi:MAG: CPBP family intramembrane glutamic endopeptidase [Myxococcota bacterium]
MSERRRALIEVGVLFLGTLLAIRAIVLLHRVGPGGEAWDVVLVGVPLLFMYAPVWACRWRGADPWDYPMAMPDWPWHDPVGFRKEWGAALVLGGGVGLAITLPFWGGYHVWQVWLVPVVEQALGVDLYRPDPSFAWRLPPDLWLLVPYHLFFVAIPEEIFYRGYLQTRLDEVFEPTWSVFGAKLGWGFVITCVLFAFGHSIVLFQWWHVFIIVPSLVFGWMRSRSGGFLAGAVFHAFCNVGVQILDHLYGIGLT